MGKVVGRYEDQLTDVYAYLAYELGSQAAAERWTAVTFERAARDREVVGFSGEPRSVSLLRLAHELAVSERSARREVVHDSPVSSGLAAGLGRLERRERTILALRFGAGLAGADIARVLGLREGEVRRRLSRGLRRLRTELEREDGGEEEHHET